MTRVGLLWHMHQPYYEDLVTGEHLLPWVRLHALKDYYGMVALLDEFPEVRVTFNLVPSLLVQIEAFAEGRARDRALDVSLRPAGELDDADTAFMLRDFFHAQRERMIGIHPRYAELLARRGDAPPADADARAVAARFSIEDLRDLQVWHKLAWMDPAYLEGDARLRRLVEQGRGFTETDKLTLRDVELELLNAVIPAYRKSAARGQVELSTSPFYHPILPLLCDTDVYERTHPGSPKPRRRFAHPEDAMEQLARAVACHERLFGARPAGLWPSEGSVSDAMVPLAARAGFTWMASDETILARTLGLSLTRDEQGRVQQPERLYRPYVVTAGGSQVACAFRDHALSDRIGFVYAGWPAEQAAEDFVARLVDAGRRFTDRTGGEEAFIPVILDGENAWEHFEGGGRPFLRALYARLSAHPELRTVTMADGCAGAAEVLPGIFPGSWIDGNFYIWVGHDDDRRAWSQLGDARQALDEARDVPDAVLRQAREEVLIAEGSDWFWWYGDDHSSDHDPEFDDLFRRHLRNVYRLLGRTAPDELFVTNISTSRQESPVLEPMALIAPQLDGENSSYFEWLGAGQFEVREPAGAMHQIGRPASLLTLVLFGFDGHSLYVRLDAGRPVASLLAEGLRCSIRLLEPRSLRFVVQFTDGRLTWGFGGETGPLDDSGASAAAGTVLELKLPLNELAGHGGAPSQVRFVVTLDDATGIEIERHPRDHSITALVPDARFDALHWRA